MRYPATLTIDEMPESERPKRTIYPRAAPEPQPAPKAEPAKDDGISIEDWNAFKKILFGALAAFPEARAAVLAAFAKVRESFEKQGAPIYEPA